MNNEEKILELLERSSKEQKEQGDLLRRQSILIEQLGKTQQEQGMRQMEQSTALKSLDKELMDVSRLSRQTAALAEEIGQLSQRTAVLLESEYRDKLQLLFDGHSLIEEKLDGLSPKSRVEDLEDEVSFLRSVVKSMSKRLDALEKAQ